MNSWHIKTCNNCKNTISKNRLLKTISYLPLEVTKTAFLIHTRNLNNLNQQNNAHENICCKRFLSLSPNIARLERCHFSLLSRRNKIKVLKKYIFHNIKYFWQKQLLKQYISQTQWKKYDVLSPFCYTAFMTSFLLFCQYIWHRRWHPAFQLLSAINK